MIGRTFHLDIPPPDSHDTLHDPDRDALPLQDPSLFDVQFQISGKLPGLTPGLLKAIRIAPDSPDALGYGEPALAAFGKHFRTKGPDQSPASDKPPLLVGKNPYLKGMFELDSALRKGVHDLDGGHHTHRAIESPTFRHRIDMRAKRDRPARGIAARIPADDIARRIYAHAHAGPAHEVHHKSAPRPIGIRIGNPTDASGRRAPDLGQRLQVLPQTSAVDPDLRSTGLCPQRREGEQKRK
jgi:hypothetical protein